MSGKHDDLIGFAVDEFRLAEDVVASPPGGAAAVRTIVARRRRLRRTTLGVLGALVIAVPVGAYAANPWGNNGPPSGQEVQAAVGCQVLLTAQANLDADAGMEVAVTAACRPGEILAVDRDRFGRIVTSSAPVDGRVGGLFLPEAGVGAVVSYEGDEIGAPRPQERTFGWDGSRFAQLSGPTAFVRAPADLKITSSPLELGPPDDRMRRTGRVTVTVTNRGPHPVERFVLRSSTPYSIPGQFFEDGIASGETKTLTVTVGLEIVVDAVPLLFHLGVYAFVDDPHPEDNTAPVEVLPVEVLP